MNSQNPPSVPSPHTPVLLEETLSWLDPKPGEVWVDGTVGYGGHAAAIAHRIGERGRLFGLDVDPEAIEYVEGRSKSWPPEVELIRNGYENLEAVLGERGIASVDGILLDLGVSSAQLDRAERGFSFRFEGPLDMRMDPESPDRADRWLAGASESEIRRVLRRYGEEKRAQSIAQAIVRAREKHEIRTTRGLAEIIVSCFPGQRRSGGVHPATRAFQALRLEVNKELERLESFLSFFPTLLETGGRVAFLAYHSLEDRLVKRALLRWCDSETAELGRLPFRGETEGWLRLLFRGAKRPTQEEIRRNPRSRSARLRAAVRTERPIRS